MEQLKQAIGLDIGGTKIAVAAVDAGGRICARLSLPTEAELGFARAVERLHGAITQVMSEAGWITGEVQGIGMGCAGPVDPFHGTINNPYTLTGWNNCDLVSPLRERFQVPVFLENDADAAVLGECWAGAGRGCESAVMLTLGTGIGGGALANGRLLRGADGGHPELGHVPVEPGGPPCYCGTKGCFESIASGTAIGAAGKEAGFADSREVFAAAALGHATARSIVNRAIRATATAAWTILHTLMPERIILGGGLMDEHYEMFAATVREQIQRATLVPQARVEVVKAVLGNEAGLVGAASLAFPVAAMGGPSATVQTPHCGRAPG